jgi:hypothetical protein
MIPLFVSDNSIGRSILKINPTREGGPMDILSLAQIAELEEVFLVEDSMVGFLEAHKTFSNEGIPLRFGVRFNMCNDVLEENKKSSSYKIILFAKNDQGCKELYGAFSAAHVEHGGFLDSKTLRGIPNKNLIVAHPFYDSYLFHNTMYFKNCLYEPLHDEELFFYENNGLPFDALIKSKLPEDSVLSKTILYNYSSDVEAYQVYRMACNRTFGRQRSLSSPNLEHFGSDEFCFQSYMEHTDGQSS